MRTSFESRGTNTSPNEIAELRPAGLSKASLQYRATSAGRPACADVMPSPLTTHLSTSGGPASSLSSMGEPTKWTFEIVTLTT